MTPALHRSSRRAVTLPSHALPDGRAKVGVLPDGTRHLVPVGEVWTDGTHVCCHLCGRWFRSVTVHLRSHGWTVARYREQLGLEQSAPLEGLCTRDRRARALESRQRTEPAVVLGIATGRELARSGELAAYAATSARGRAHSPQRLAKTRAALAAVSPANQAAANRRRGVEQIVAAGQQAADRLGYDTIADFVVDRVSRGVSLASASREARLGKDWLQRHLAVVAPDVAATLDTWRLPAAEARLARLVEVRGHDGVEAYLQTRHREDGLTVRAMSLELGVARSTIETSLLRYGMHRVGNGATGATAASDAGA